MAHVSMVEEPVPRTSAPDAPRVEEGGPTDDAVCRLLARTDAWAQTGHAESALRTLLSARRRFSFVPLAVLDRTIQLCRQLGREQVAAEECLASAGDSFRMGYPDLGLEAVSAALVLDGLGDLAITRSPPRLRGIAEWYEQVAVAGERRTAPVRDAGGPLRVAILVPSLVDHVVAYTKSVLCLARYADPSRFALRVYVSENLVRRIRPLFPFGCVGDPTPRQGAVALSELRERGIPVALCPLDLRFRKAGRFLARRIEEDGADMVLAITGMACPIDWLALRSCSAPVRAALHIGASLFMPGLDVTYYDNPVNVTRERAWWTDRFGDRVVIPLGADVAELDRQAAMDRAALGLPASAVVVGTMSNHLAERLREDYLNVIALALARHPTAWFLAVGASELPAVEAFFRTRGVADRVRFLERQARVGAVVKIFDIYANEFPVGGSKSVMEAMACGVPVVALRWSDAHAECAGAEIAGPEMAVNVPDPAEYGARLESLMENASLRREAGARCSRRARTRYAVDSGTRRILDDLAQRHTARCAAFGESGGATHAA